MIEHFLWIAIPMAVGMAFGYTAGGILRNKINVFLANRDESVLLARLNFSLLFALLLSVGFVVALWALIYSIGGTFDLSAISIAPESALLTFVQLTGYAMGFLGLPGAFGFFLVQLKGDWEKKREREDDLRTFAAPQL